MQTCLLLKLWNKQKQIQKELSCPALHHLLFFTHVLVFDDPLYYIILIIQRKIWEKYTWNSPNIPYIHMANCFWSPGTFKEDHSEDSGSAFQRGWKNKNSAWYAQILIDAAKVALWLPSAVIKWLPWNIWDRRHPLLFSQSSLAQGMFQI